MKFTAILLLISSLQLSARGYSQTVTLKFKNAALKDAFKEIEKQSGYNFIYLKEQLKKAKSVTLVVVDEPLEKALEEMFEGQPLTYTISGTYIAVRERKDMPPAITVVKATPPPLPVRGRVLDDKGDPVLGITVSVKGSNVATQTDGSGNFSINVPDGNSIIVFTSVGFETKEVSVDGKGNVGDISLVASNLKLDEIVVTGYSTQRKKDITGAVSVVNTADLKAVPGANATAQLQGRASGVTVIQNGTPGVQAKVRIRGLGSFQNNSPLYVVDGVQTTDISGINPNDIESMQVLKDAASASIYGVRSSNGVIVITTKKARKGGVVVNYDMYYGTQLPGDKYNDGKLNVVEDAELLFLTARNSGETTVGSIYGNGTTPVLPDYTFAGLGGTAGVKGPLFEGNPAVNPSLYSLDYTKLGDAGYAPYIIIPANKQGTNWWKLATRNAPIQNHNLTLGSGSDNSRYLLSLNYFNQDAFTIYQFYKRYSARLNSEFTIKKRVRLGENLQIFFSESNVQGNGSGGNKSNNQEDSDISAIIGTQSILPLYTIVPGDFAGSAGPWGGKNAVGRFYRNRRNRSNNVNVFGNVYGEVDLIRGMTFRSSFGGVVNTNNNFSFPVIEYENSLNQNTPTYSENFVRNSNWIFTNQLSYKMDFGDHSISALLGTEATENGGRQNIGSSSGFYTYNSPNFFNLSNGATQNLGGSGKFQEQTTQSYFASANYSYKDKFLLGALVRRDGTSKFIDSLRWGNFPAFSAGWRISEESFMKNISWITDLKIRGSWGQSGNEAAVPSNNSLTTFASARSSSYYDFTGSNTTPTEGFYQNFQGFPFAQWERNESFNIGIDATIFKNTEIVFDFYNKKTKDLLVATGGQDLLGGAAATRPAFKNVGSMKNWGIDIAATNRAIFGDFKLTTSLTLTTYKNEITSIDKELGVQYFDFNSPSAEANRLGGSTITRNMIGQPLNTYFGYEVIGIFQSQAEVDAAPNQSMGSSDNTAYPGSFRYQDVNGDKIIDDKDRKVIGDPNPDFTYGLNFDLDYKRFDINAFFYGVQGKENYAWYKWGQDFSVNFTGSKSKAALYDSWLPDGSRPNAKTPIQLSSSSPSASGVVNSYFVEDASYFRLRNLQIGYTFSAALLGKIGVSKARVYLQGTNLFTITKYPGLDPDVVTNDERASGIDLGTYPTLRQLSVGASISF